ncbi:MAG: hypothetical protein AYP45_03540 [Candidatus Brocadia carolinensis]|uniref:Transposase DDE domain-containing protein n=1 Tax=Candidatus Brocadia carolinensis TaxID=1004156 RepID=A0A1V4AWD8_9BACT|nr:MAG: hypothetical protein AYP45_03540 [Candidatus Brocadia caroliniensis]
MNGVYGNQQGADVGYNPCKKGQKSYHPIIACVAETKEILHSWLRCGSAYTRNGVVEFMKECMAYTKKRVRVIVRGDSGFFSGELLDYLESISAGYLIKVKMKNLIGLLEGQKWEAVEGDAGWEQADFMYQCAVWYYRVKTSFFVSFFTTLFIPIRRYRLFMGERLLRFARNDNTQYVIARVFSEAISRFLKEELVAALLRYGIVRDGLWR